VRAPPAEIAVLVGAWMHACNPTWRPEGINPAALDAALRRMHSGFPRKLDPDVPIMALEAIGLLGAQGPTVNSHALFWANRSALLAVGDPSAALSGIAWNLGAKDAPAAGDERAAWIARTPEARDIIAFSVTDAYAEARAKLGLDR
jgi:hypothetical protein